MAILVASVEAAVRHDADERQLNLRSREESLPLNDVASRQFQTINENARISEM